MEPPDPDSLLSPKEKLDLAYRTTILNEDVFNYFRVYQLMEPMALQGNADAQFYCGWLCCKEWPRFQKDSIVKDYPKALDWYLNAAEQGHALAMLYIGDLYQGCVGIAPNIDASLYWYERALLAGEEAGAIRIAEQYYKGKHTPVDKKKALYWFERGGQMGSMHCMDKCVKMYETGDGIPKDLSKAFYWCKRAVMELDCSFLYAKYAKMCYYGEGTSVDLKEAFYWYERAAKDERNCEAQYMCGRMYLNGEGTEPDTEKAISYLKRGQARGHADASCLLTKLQGYENPLDAATAFCEQGDYDTARSILVSLSNQGSAEANYQLGLLYEEKKLEADQDDRYDSQLFRIESYLGAAARKGHVKAQYKLGCFYLTTDDRNPSLTAAYRYKNAYTWLLKAAQQGYGPAQVALGLMYIDNNFEDHNDRKAFYWFRLAADQNYLTALLHCGEMYLTKTNSVYNPEIGLKMLSEAAQDPKYHDRAMAIIKRFEEKTHNHFSDTAAFIQKTAWQASIASRPNRNW